MPIDTTEVGHIAAELMDRLASEEQADDAQVGVVGVVVEIDCGASTAIYYRCNDGRHWVQAGLFDAAKRAVLDQQEIEE